MTRVRPATRDDADDLARTHVNTWHTAYTGLIPDVVLATIVNGTNTSTPIYRICR